MPGTYVFLIALRDYSLNSQGIPLAAFALFIGVNAQPRAETNNDGASESESNNKQWWYPI